MMSVDDQVTSSQADVFPNVLTIAPSSILAVSPTGDDLNEEDENIAVSPGALLSSQGYLVSPSLNNPTLQGLLTSPSGLQGAQLGLPEGIQIINLSSPSSILPAQSDGRIWHVISPDDTIIAVGNEDFKQALANGEVIEDGDQISATTTMSVDNLEVQADLSSVLMPPPQQPLPPGCPAWAARLKNCEKIGDYYRGYVDTDVELDILLTYHKQATQSFWGTRQSPSPAKQSTRFMWKSQYVPYDGVPFVNTGSRAVVMECQYGPRRKASWTKKQMDSSKEYKQTCPARIYIKKVRKFPEFKIDTGLDKKIMKSAMDKAFHCLKTQNVEKIGQDRYYVQLPLPSAHEFHYDMPTRGANGTIIPQIQVSTHTQTQESQTGEINSEDTETSSDKKQHRLHPLVAQKIREIVASGETRVYHVRRNLRMFVCQELYNGQMDGNLSRHDLSLFPTVTDLKNHIHQAVKDIESGVLALTAPQVSVEQLTASGDNMVQLSELGLLQHTPAVVSSGQGPVPETVTVTLTQSPGDDNGHVISRIETHMSDGTTQISSSLTPETAQLLARLNPAMFPPGSLVQLKADPESQLTVQAVTSDMSNSTDLDHASFVSMGNSSSIDTHSYAEMDLENPSPEESLNIQSAVDSALAMPSLVTGQVSAAIMSTGNPSLNEQSAQLINVSIVPTEADLEDMQAECCEDDL